MSPTFASLGVRNYRIYATGAFVSNIGTWMGRVAQDWLVLTQLTQHSSSALGIVTGLQFLPFLLLAPWTGVVADRFSKRRLLAVTQTALALSSLGLGVVTVTGHAQLWMVYVAALWTGVATAFDNPARQTFVSEMVPRDRLTNAVSLNSASFNAGRLVGPGVAGLTIAAFGTGWTLLVNTLTFVAANLTISARPVTVTADAKSKTYGDNDPALTYTGALHGSDSFTGNLVRDAGENVAWIVHAEHQSRQRHQRDDDQGER